MKMRDERGLVGKLIVVWLLLVALLGVAAMDTFSIMFARFRLSDVAVTGAATGATSYSGSRNEKVACDAALRAMEQQDPDVKVGKGFCKVDARTGEVTITLKTTAGTVVAGKLSITEDLTHITVKETGVPNEL
jgi:hypothetical protein